METLPATARHVRNKSTRFLGTPVHLLAHSGSANEVTANQRLILQLILKSHGEVQSFEYGLNEAA